MCPRIDFRNVYILLILGSAICVSSYRVELIDNGPIVKGANITFKASVYYGDKLAEGTFVYSWKDMALPTHTREYKATSPIDEWIVSYNSSIYPQGPYIVQVTVCKYYLVYCAEIASNRVEFYINETLNGDILFIQNNKTRPDLFVSNAEPVIHNVSLKQTDAEYIKQAPSVLTYWFVDCVYWGFRNDFEFSFNYTQAEREHLVEALVIADFSPPPPPLTTTTVKPTTTTTKTTTKPSTTVTTTKPTTTTTKPTTTTTKPTTTTNSTKVKRDVGPQSKIWVSENGTLQPFKGTYPFVCNGTQVATDEQKTYGYFFKKVKVRAPVAKVNVTGNNWLQHGDLLTLNVRCHGSKNFKYCVQYQKGLYNVTGNETCYFYQELDKCEFTIQRYFVDSMEHTVVIIIQNEVSKIVYPVTVTVYKVQRQAQLSVIVVPVAFSLVAVVLIVFGVAYYIQNRSRFVVEVADFNFGQNYSDMEYKTFKERLRDAIANAFFTRAPSPGSSEVPVWPPGRKYGSMTS